MWFEKIRNDGEKIIFVSLPGVPHEMKWLLTNAVIPKLKKQFHFSVVLHETAITFGMGESSVAEMLQPFENTLPSHIKLAYLPNFGMVKLRLTSKGENKKPLQNELKKYFEELKKIVKNILVADEDVTMEVIVGNLLKQKNKTLATAESCTGGNIAHLITTVPGSSVYFKGSVVAYANEIKKNILGVQNRTLKTAGAVSEATVIEMLKGVLHQLKTDYAVAVSGIMGPDGGTLEKPTGTVWIAVGNKKKIETKLLQLRFDRERNIEVASVQALNFLRKFITENG
jgi:nicotinamide-nucleotide amidase